MKNKIVSEKKFAKNIKMTIFALIPNLRQPQNHPILRIYKCGGSNNLEP